MATAFTHALVGSLLSGLAPEQIPRLRLAVVLAVLAVLPDIDIAAFALGIPYGHALGHRGLTHSLPFALVGGFASALALFPALSRFSRAWWAVAGLCSLALASHGLLDALTDAGLGVGFFIPFSDARIFLPWRPLETSPIGVPAFFSGPALRILANEMRWVALPLVAAAGLIALGRSAWRRQRRSR